MAISANEIITLSDEEISNIGIELSSIIPVSQSLTNKLPAKVTIPNKSQRVVSAPQDGVIEVMLVAEGDHITKGQELSQINSPQLLVSQNHYLQALIASSLTKEVMERDKSLFDDGIIAERRYRQSQIAYQRSDTEVVMNRKSLALAGMDSNAIKQLDKTRSMNSHLTVTANSSGVVMKQFATAGQRLTASDPLYQIAQLSQLWLEIHVPLDIANQVSMNDRLVICNRAIEGKVIAIGREVHDADQGVLVRAQVSHKTEQLTPGEFLQVCFIQQSTDLQFEVLRSAVFRHEGEAAVFVETEGGFIYKTVEIITDNGEKLIIKGDLSVSQSIVIAGTATLKAAWLGMGGE
jgi:RND family efflux transporter MFP subunit